MKRLIFFTLIIIFSISFAYNVTLERLYKNCGIISSIGKGYHQISNVLSFDYNKNIYYIIDNVKNSLIFYDIKISKVIFEKNFKSEFLDIFYKNKIIYLFFKSNFYIQLNAKTKTEKRIKLNFIPNKVFTFNYAFIIHSTNGKFYKLYQNNFSEISQSSTKISSKRFTDLFKIQSRLFYLIKDGGDYKLNVYDSAIDKHWDFMRYTNLKPSIIRNASMIKKSNNNFIIKKINTKMQNYLNLQFLFFIKEYKKALDFINKQNIDISNSKLEWIKEKIIGSSSSSETTNLYDKYNISNSFTKRKKRKEKNLKLSFSTISKIISIGLLILMFIFYVDKSKYK